MENTEEYYQKKVLSLNSLVELSLTINSLNISSILDVVSFTSMGELMAEGTFIFLPDTFDENSFVLEKYKGAMDFVEGDYKIYGKSELLKKLDENKMPIRYGNLGQEERIKAILADINDLSPEIIAPFLIRDEVNGMLILSKKISGESYSDEDIDFIDTLCKIAGIAIENARLYEEATYDFKTGLYLYKNFKDRANKELSRAVRFSHELSAIMVDIDFFKKINDNYGHDVGDVVLTHFGEIIRAGIRDFDIPGRFGGEEFIIICPNTDKVQAENLCQRLQEVIRGYSFPAGEGFIKVRASFGISQLKEGDNASLDKLIKRADEALYLSKQNGRDMITVSG